MPFFDQPKTPAMGEYTAEYQTRWARRIAAGDGFVFVTAESSVRAAIQSADLHIPAHLRSSLALDGTVTGSVATVAGVLISAILI
jgi:NAD(P)H-dependent FMN reductase